MTPLRCGIIGYGMIGRTHAGILGALPDADIVGIADSNPAQWPTGEQTIPVFESAATLLDSVELDAIWVCTPPEQHREIVVEALERGIHVYCEKPIAHDLDDARAMRDAAAQSSATFAVGHTLRFHPDVQALAQIVSSGSIGEPVQANARWATNDREGRLLSGRVSVAQEMSIHHIDVLRWCMGDVVEVIARASSVTPCGAGPDAISGILRFANGATATLDHNWIMPAASGVASDQRIGVFGTTGTAYFDAHEPFTRRYSTDGAAHVHTAYRGFDPAVPAGALANADRWFLATVRDGLGWPATADDAISALEVALAMEKSIATGSAVAIGGRHGN